MKRGELTNVNQLSPGDRFYKASDKKKTAYHMIGEKTHQKFEVCESIVADRGGATARETYSDLMETNKEFQKKAAMVKL